MTKKKDVRTRAEAKKLMWEYYRDNKASLPKWIGEFREEVLSELRTGLLPEKVFGDIVQNEQSDTKMSLVPCNHPSIGRAA